MCKDNVGKCVNLWHKQCVNDMEELMQYVWAHRLWPTDGMSTVDGRPVQVLDPGCLNRNAGPDFFNAKVKIDGRIWCGNVEIHVRATDWHRHGHHHDRAYDSVILHVVERDDCEICRPGGEVIPQMKMPCARDFAMRYGAFVNNSAQELACARELATVSPMYLRDWIDAMAFERINAKADRVEGWLDRFSGSWEDAAYVTLARALGAGVNGDAFERLALSVPLRFMLRHADSRLSVEALLFGQSGLLPDGDGGCGGYAAELSGEYRFLAGKFSLNPPSDLAWRMSRMRPAAFPHRRVALLASMIADGFNVMQKVLDAETEEDARAIFDNVTLSGYWLDHHTFARGSDRRVSSVALGRQTVDMLIINVVVPLLVAYGRSVSDASLTDRAVDILEHLPAERNSVVGVFERAGIKCGDAFVSQALIELRREYCDARKCLYCRIGHRLLAAKVKP